MDKKGALSFRDLVVWQRAHKLVLDIYLFTRGFPAEENYGLKSQMRRCAVSVAANIAEGFKKKGRADKIRYFNIAEGSLEECRYYLILSQDLQYGETGEFTDAAEEVSKLLYAYSHAIQTRKF
jgi:four helix bundle protein